MYKQTFEKLKFAFDPFHISEETRRREKMFAKVDLVDRVELERCYRAAIIARKQKFTSSPAMSPRQMSRQHSGTKRAYEWA